MEPESSRIQFVNCRLPAQHKYLLGLCANWTSSLSLVAFENLVDPCDSGKYRVGTPIVRGKVVKRLFDWNVNAPWHDDVAELSRLHEGASRC